MKVELHLFMMDWYRHGETLHAVYLTMLSVCTYHIKNHKCRERSQKKGLFPSLNNTRAVWADLCSTKVSARGEKYTLSCVTYLHSLLPLMICTDTSKLPCTQTHGHMRAHTHTHTESSYTSASVSCRYNLQSDTWRSANNYNAIKQANPGGAETMIKKATR